jgi:hypothetical protein
VSRIEVLLTTLASSPTGEKSRLAFTVVISGAILEHPVIVMSKMLRMQAEYLINLVIIFLF